MKGEYPDERIGTMTGDLSRRGNDIAVLDSDPDALLSPKGPGKGIALERTAALLLPGPPFAEAARERWRPDTNGETPGGKGTVRTLVSDWIVGNGVFRARDVAATKEHRVALAGRIYLPAGRFDGVPVDLVDDNGCAIAGRTIEEPFRLPRISGASAARGTPPPAKKPTREAKRAGTAETCEPFYTGSVPPPN